MNISKVLGPAAPDLGWVPAPRYLLRRNRIHQFLKDLPNGHLLEIGPGAGALLVEFTKKGFECEALERSPEALKLLKEFTEKFDTPVPCNEEPSPEWSDKFDVICAFDVLEHIENDSEALTQWSDWLRPGGALLLSVPAHMRSWNYRDVWAGHFRRYEKEDLKELFRKNGYLVEKFECYGVPLANLAEIVSSSKLKSVVSAREKAKHNLQQRGTDLSGVDRKLFLKYYPLLESVLGKLTIWLFMQLQKPFLNSDLGNGYIILGRKL